MKVRAKLFFPLSPSYALSYNGAVYGGLGSTWDFREAARRGCREHVVYLDDWMQEWHTDSIHGAAD